MSDNIENNNEKIDTSNIFEDFENDFSLRDDIIKTEEDIKKDSIYYLSVIWNIIKYLNLFLILVVLIAWTYIWVQNSGNLSEKSFLDPVCPVLLWNSMDLWATSCSSVTAALEDYNKKYEVELESSLYKVIPLIESLFLIEDFQNSKRVSFVLDKSENKENPMLILKEFDKVKYDFTEDDKAIVSCSNIKIYEDTLEAECSSYSSIWDSQILWFDGKKDGDFIRWTSITIASSFLNYLDLSPKFKVVNPQKEFTSERVVQKWFTRKTDFKLKLKYNNDILSL